MRQKTLQFLFHASLLFCIHFTTNAQVKLGVKWGYNAPFVQGNMGWSKGIFHLKYPKSLLPGHVGLALKVPVGKVFAIQPEAFISMSGYSYYDPYLMNDVLNAGGDLDWVKKELGKHDPEWTDSFYFISVPLLLKARFKGFGVYAGPQYDHLLKANLEYFNHSTAKTEKESHNRNYRIGSQYSVVGGIDYTMKFGLGFNVRYQRGLSRVDKVAEGGIFSSENEMKNDILMVGFQFFIGKYESQ
jgi:hypothetical protein